jgi:hypothetical protein
MEATDNAYGLWTLAILNSANLIMFDIEISEELF